MPPGLLIHQHRGDSIPQLGEDLWESVLGERNVDAACLFVRTISDVISWKSTPDHVNRGISCWTKESRINGDPWMEEAKQIGGPGNPFTSQSTGISASFDL